jgi:hypothetical protein
MPKSDFLRYDSKGIAELLDEELLAVPMYQRSYSWRSKEAQEAGDNGGDGRAQVAEFWNDLQRGYKQGMSYFLGTVVLSREGAPGGRVAVIDGQQRLATTSLLMAAIRDAYRERGQEQYAASVHSDFVAEFDRHAGKDQPKLILNSDDRDYFERVVVAGEAGIEPATESQRLLRDAWFHLQTRVTQFCAGAGDSWKTELDKFASYLEDEAQVISITVATEADAFLIFETLNDRGADLTIADLLKNFLFSQAGARLDEVRDAWVVTLDNLDIPKVGNKRFNLFARHFMSSKRGPVRERELYGRIKDEVGDAAGAVSFAKDLQDNARLYFALISVDSDVWGEFSETTRQAAEVLVGLNLEQSRPLLLAALAVFQPHEIERLLPTMVSWSIRGLCGGQLGGGVAEAAFCSAAQRIRAGKIGSVEGILKDPGIDRLIPNDRVFEADFSEWRVMRGSLARYILRALELEHRGDPEPELVVNPDVRQVNLEHILPKSPKKGEWAHFGEEEDQKLYLHRLGNMALLQQGANGRIGNKPWAVKKPILLGSELKLTQEAGAATVWDPTAVDGRQERMAALALKAWPRLPR